MMDGMGWSGMWFGWIFWLVLLVVIIWVVITIVNRSPRYGSQEPLPRREDALEILKKRYARGEISREQFEQMKKDLIP
ncbi:MAG: SHOCT domain-containing protein [Ignavibacteriaceae bacterium]